MTITITTRLMVGYGSHTRVPHMNSPLLSWMAYWLEVSLLIILTIFLNEESSSSTFNILIHTPIILILIRIYNG